GSRCQDNEPRFINKTFWIVELIRSAATSKCTSHSDVRFFLMAKRGGGDDGLVLWGGRSPPRPQSGRGWATTVRGRQILLRLPVLPETAPLGVARVLLLDPAVGRARA